MSQSEENEPRKFSMILTYLWKLRLDGFCIPDMRTFARLTMGMYVPQFPQHDEQTHGEYESGKQHQTDNLNQLPPNLTEPPLAGFIEGDDLWHSNLLRRHDLGGRGNGLPTSCRK
jgi:hypothetical protein